MSSHNQHYFERRGTYEIISQLSEPQDLTIYVGLGGTIDRTNLSWNLLVARLFSRFGLAEEQARVFVERNGPVESATALESLYLAEAEKESEANTQLAQDIHSHLYGSRKWMQGRLLRSLVDYACEVAVKGFSVRFVTPNYDEYLVTDLKDSVERLPEEARGRLIEPKVEYFNAESWKSDSSSMKGIFDALREPGLVSCSYIHGHIPREGVHIGEPVMGEVSYHESATRTRAVLTELFTDSAVVVVGSRVVDAPLIQGFLDTRNSGKPRTVFQAMQSSEWQGLSALELRQALNINDQRLKALKVKSVRPDFYGQIGQIFAEAAHCIRLAVSAEIRSETCAARYDHRLEEWWRTWREEALLIHYPDHGGAEEPVADWAAYPDSSQYRHHVKLVHAVERVRSLLDASPAENLKLEVWSRWEPNKDRQLCLWASSVGPFLDTQIMRRDDIKVGSKYKSVQVFCAGAPMFLHEGDDEEGDTRWKSYFALPIWLEADDRSQLPVGVVSLASMRHGNPANRSQKPGSVSEANLKYIFAAISVMQTVGAEILSPS